MCGIAGFYQANDFTEGFARTVASRMADVMALRGPDGAGVWLDARAGIALAHRRLAVIELSPAGHQPMLSHSGRYALTFNGEIYNHLQLREKVDRRSSTSMPWRGNSDTETLLACIDHLGLEETLRSAIGMFAFGLWDRQDRVLHLARDRLGEKPLYYGWQNQTFLFGSDPSALKRHPAFAGEINHEALTLFLRFSYIPAPWSIYRGIHKLPPGTRLCLPLNGARTNTVPPEPRAYWSPADIVSTARREPFTGNDDEAVTTLHDLLFESVGRQMVADVPLGAFLSGGIDSSIITALMQAQSKRPVQTFTIGFHEAGYNEARHAKKIADYLGTEHTEIYVSPTDAMNVIPNLPALYSEPFADSSQIPTFLVAELARRDVTVCLSGDGGDELFGGYPRYTFASPVWRALSVAPPSLLKAVASGLMNIRPDRMNELANGILSLLPVAEPTIHLGAWIHKLAGILSRPHSNRTEFLDSIRSVWHEPPVMHRRIVSPNTASILGRWSDVLDIKSQAMLMDLLIYLPDNILAKVDRAAMGVSLETRMPFLDHRLVEWTSRLPLSFKIRRRVKKWILREIRRKYLPAELDKQPKRGFVVPIHAWLGAELRDWAESQIDEARLRREGFLDPQPIRQKWAEHLSGRYNWSQQIWSVLMFQSWLEKNAS